MGCAFSVSNFLNITFKGTVNRNYSFLESVPLVFKDTYDFNLIQIGLVFLGKQNT